MRLAAAALPILLGGCAAAMESPVGSGPGTGFLDRIVEVDGTAYPYQVYVPRDYDPSRRWPVVLFLPGAGERGTDGLLQTEVGLGSAIRRFPARFPAIVVLPQAPPDSTWLGEPGRAAMAALERTEAEFATDPDRTALTGLSMGGLGAWALAFEHPDRFERLLVVCGWVAARDPWPGALPDSVRGSPYEALAQRIRGLPVWIVHGESDPVVPVEESRRTHAALEAAGADVRYTELEGVGHGAWDPAYRDPEIARWLLGDPAAGRGRGGRRR